MQLTSTEVKNGRIPAQTVSRVSDGSGVNKLHQSCSIKHTGHGASPETSA